MVAVTNTTQNKTKGNLQMSEDQLQSMSEEEFVNAIIDMEPGQSLDGLACQGILAFHRPKQIAAFSTNINECGILFLNLARIAKEYQVKAPGHGAKRVWTVEYTINGRNIVAEGPTLEVAITRAGAFLAYRWVQPTDESSPAFE